jgi:uncharacterized Zn-binding protein involved in type VI secretion
MGEVFANGRSILHKGDGTTHVAAPPDVCKVPTPGGPVPTPFVNSAQDAMLTKGSKTTVIEGNAIALASSELSTSSGDEPGTAGGIISSKFKGKLTWGSSSIDVKVEGKGVVRFLDSTLHNGNTSNDFFASNGRTKLAYGDDTQCELCGKTLSAHRVHETHEVRGDVGEIFLELGKRFNDQKPLIDRHQELNAECKKARKEADDQAEPVRKRFDTWKEGKDKQIEILRSGFSAPNADKKSIRSQVSVIENEIQAEELKRNEEIKQLNTKVRELEAEMKKINEELSAKNVLTSDTGSKTYTKGYMVGACVCKCPQAPKKLAACSGKATPGFKEAVTSAKFTRVEGFNPSQRQREWLEKNKKGKWECAAPQLLNAGNASGHKAAAMSERFYSPQDGGTVRVTHMHTDKEGREALMTHDYGHGESVPSCERCQALLPEMLCENDEECG